MTHTYGQNGSAWVQVKDSPIEANELEHKFGELIQNQRALVKFELKNTQSQPLVIKHVTTSCGCTTTKFTKSPVKKGETAQIKVKYDTSKPGVFSKSVFVYTNFIEKPIKLNITGKVIPDAANKSVRNGSIKKKEISFEGKIPQNQ